MLFGNGRVVEKIFLQFRMLDEIAVNVEHRRGDVLVNRRAGRQRLIARLFPQKKERDQNARHADAARERLQRACVGVEPGEEGIESHFFILSFRA